MGGEPADAAVGSAGKSVDAVASSSGASDQRKPPCYLIVYNITKRHNIGNIARSATAFGVAQVCDACELRVNGASWHSPTNFYNTWKSSELGKLQLSGVLGGFPALQRLWRTWR